MDEILDFQEQQSEPQEVIPVSQGIRFANYIIDYIIFYVFLVAILVPFILDGSSMINTLTDSPILDRLLTLVAYACFMAIQETLLKGRTIGKFITGTKVVDWSGNTPDSGTLIKRNLYRAVPFDPLSFGGSRGGWHDRWSDTYVVKNR